jgi:GT2 family glycosyltransferase
MKLACVLITLGREDLTRRVITQNFYNAGLDADVFLVDNGSPLDMHHRICAAYPFRETFRYEQNMGVSRAINKGFQLAAAYDAVVIMANDILMPEGWLAEMHKCHKWIKDCGLIGVHCVESLPAKHDFYPVHHTFCPFGNIYVPREVIRYVGGFNVDFLKYGMNDSEYGYRVHKAGFFSFYLGNGMKSEHIGHDMGEQTEYRKMKDAGMAVALGIYNNAVEQYEKTNSYYRPVEA